MRGRVQAAPSEASAWGNPEPQLPMPFAWSRGAHCLQLHCGGACPPRAVGVPHSNWDRALWGPLAELSEPVAAAGFPTEAWGGTEEGLSQLGWVAFSGQGGAPKGQRRK